MMHRQQRQSPKSLSSISSWASDANSTVTNSSSGSSSSSSSNNNTSSSCSNPSRDCSSPLTILSRRCSSYRSRTTTTFFPSASISNRCHYTAGAATPSSSSCPVLLSVLAWSVTLLLILSCIGIADAGVLMGHPLGKRSFMELQCKGIYDKSIFARLDRVCEDCYNLFREPQLHTLCRKSCFTSDYFEGCVEVLLLHDEMPHFKTWIKQLHGADPRF